MHEAKRDISKKVKRYPSLIFKPPVSGIGDGGQRVENAAQKYLASRAHASGFSPACGANYLAPGSFNFSCGANYPLPAPAPGTKGGLFCVCVESRNLT